MKTTYMFMGIIFIKYWYMITAYFRQWLTCLWNLLYQIQIHNHLWFRTKTHMFMEYSYWILIYVHLWFWTMTCMFMESKLINIDIWATQILDNDLHVYGIFFINMIHDHLWFWKITYTFREYSFIKYFYMTSSALWQGITCLWNLLY